MAPLPPGVGLGLRAAFASELLAGAASRATFLEVAPENYVHVGGPRRRLLEAARKRFPISLHGLCGDLAGSAALDEDFLSGLRALIAHVDAPHFSDHLCFTTLAGAEVHDLVPLPHNERAVSRAAARIRAVQDRIEVPVLVENVSATFRTPGGTMSEEAFVRAVLEEADCGLLLDVNNVWVNAQNFDFDPLAFIEALPLERVGEIHVAGGIYDDEAGCWVDTHGEDTPAPVLALLGEVIARLPHDAPVLLERDHNIPGLAALEQELARVADVVASARVRARAAA